MSFGEYTKLRAILKAGMPFVAAVSQLVTNPEIIRRTVEDIEYDIGPGCWVLRKLR